jgi:hypothetical protein
VQRYANIGGNSGVVAYALHRDSIVVRFQDGSTYEYTLQSAGAARLDTMKRLAIAGRGLSTFIAQQVHAGYARKLQDPRD